MSYRFIVSLMLVIVAFSLCAYADPVIYSNRSDFELASPGLLIEDFEEAMIAPGTEGIITGDLDKNTDNAYFKPGDILDGLRISAGTPPEFYVEGAGVMSTSKGVMTKYTLAIDISFYNNNATAVGLDVVPWLIGDIYDLVVQGASGQLYQRNYWDVREPFFFGIVAPETITGITIESTFAYPIYVDNIAFGTPVPEPSTLLLLTTGLSIAGLAAWRRKK